MQFQADVIHLNNLGNREIEFSFLTDFSDPIVLSLDISLYTYLREIATIYAKTVKDIKGSLRSFAQDEPKSALDKSSSTTETDDKRVYLPKKFYLNPTISFLGDSTPSLEKVFRWLGIKDTNHSIPKATHVAITETLETVLKLIWETVFILVKTSDLSFFNLILILAQN